MTESLGQPRVAAWRYKAQAVFALAIGVIAVVSTVAFFIFYFRDKSDISAYQSASSCASAGDALNGQGCRYEGQARVLGTSRHDRLEARVAFESIRGRNFATSFPNGDEPDTTALKVGGTATAELWDSKVTQLAGKATVDDPVGSETTPFLILSVIFGAFAVVIFVLAIPLATAAWRQK
jgi:hypothetical protein